MIPPRHKCPFYEFGFDTGIDRYQRTVSAFSIHVLLAKHGSGFVEFVYPCQADPGRRADVEQGWAFLIVTADRSAHRPWAMTGWEKNLFFKGFN